MRNEYISLVLAKHLKEPIIEIARLEKSNPNKVCNQAIDSFVRAWYDNHQDVDCPFYLLSAAKKAPILQAERENYTKIYGRD